MEKNCSTCAWHDSFSWVCFNGLSEHRADFTDPENMTIVQTDIPTPEPSQNYTYVGALG